MRTAGVVLAAVSALALSACDAGSDFAHDTAREAEEAMMSPDHWMPVAELLPDQFEEISALLPAAVYDRGSLFEYMNGAGELYLGFAFSELAVRQYEDATGTEIVAESYDMGSSEDAFGIHTHDNDGERVDLGQGALYSPGLLRLWRDQIFVRLFSQSENPDTIRLLTSFGQHISDAIGRDGSVPELLGVLDQWGTLEAGKLADVLVVNGDPLVDLSVLRDVHRVYLGGELMVKDGMFAR